MIILTDLSEVLIRGLFGVDELIREKYNPEVAKRFLNRCHEMNPMFCMLMRGKITEDSYWRIFLGYYKWPFGLDEIKGIVSCNLAKTIAGTLDVYKRITSHPESFPSTRYRDRFPAARIEGRPRIWIVSDHIAERREELEALHPSVFDIASEVFWSYDYGTIKRDYGFFEYLLHINILAPNEAVFIDDMGENLHSASHAGIKGIKFNGNAKELESRLTDIGFTFAPQQKKSVVRCGSSTQRNPANQ